MPEQDDTPIDKNRRPVMIGDIIRVFHFTARSRKRKVFMYKVVVKVDEKLEICGDGNYWYAVDIQDCFAKGTDIAHRCQLDSIGEFEIIDGRAVERPEGLQCWWERPKQKKPSAKQQTKGGVTSTTTN